VLLFMLVSVAIKANSSASAQTTPRSTAISCARPAAR
jgi:hypothetical protein